MPSSAWRQELTGEHGGRLVGLEQEQDRVFGAETTTDGYTTLKLFSSYSFQTGRATSTLTARLDNTTNELYRNHLSLIKDVVPEMGRNVRAVELGALLTAARSAAPAGLRTLGP